MSYIDIGKRFPAEPMKMTAGAYRIEPAMERVLVMRNRGGNGKNSFHREMWPRKPEGSRRLSVITSESRNLPSQDEEPVTGQFETVYLVLHGGGPEGIETPFISNSFSSLQSSVQLPYLLFS